MKNKEYTRIIYFGNLREQNQGFVGSVYSVDGICPALRARDYKEPILVMVWNIKKVII